MPYYIRDPLRDHNFDNHPCIEISHTGSRISEAGILYHGWTPFHTTMLVEFRVGVPWNRITHTNNSNHDSCNSNTTCDCNMRLSTRAGMSYTNSKRRTNRGASIPSAQRNSGRFGDSQPTVGWIPQGWP